VKSTLELQMLCKVHKDATPISEIDWYLDGPLVEWNGLDDPNWVLQWWKANSSLYPIMSRVARDYLPIPPAEVDCERLFCSSCDLIGLRRHSMTPETMKAVLLIRDSYRRNEV
jgi:zinc finger BED domain-containing protein 1 (E3 SUMO-protein ligase ZBED1)